MPNIAYCEDETTSSELEEQLSDQTDELLSGMDFADLEAALADMDMDFNLFNGKSFKSYVKSVICGEQTISIGGIFDIFLSALRENAKAILAPLTAILVVVLLCSLLSSIKAGKVSKVGEVIQFICFAVIVIIVARLSAGLISSTKTSLVRLQNQMNAIFPVLITLMSVMGGVASVKAYSPMVAFLSNSISNIFLYVLLPLFSFSLVLSFVGNLSQNTRLSKLNSFIGSLFKWIIGVTFSLFIGIMSIQGITAGSSDGISIKATKFAIKNYIPLLGGYISDGFELVKASGLLVKNATGFAGIIMLLGTIVAPIITIGLLELGLKLLAGIIEPIGDQRSSNLLYMVAKSIRLLVVILIGVSLMYFLTIFLITCSVSNFI